MTKEGLVRQFFNLNKQLYEKAKNPLKCHGPGHHFRVWENVEYVVKKMKIKPDYSVLIPAIFLHDITAFEPDAHDPWNHQEDLDEARYELNKIKYPKDKIEQVLKIIAVHGSNTNKIKKEEPIEATLLRDADKMDVLGPIGVARVFMALTRSSGFALKDFVQKYYREKIIQEKYRSIKTKAARDKVKKDYQFSVLFFRNLAKDLKESESE